MRRPYSRPRKRPLTRIAIVVAGCAVLAAGWRLTSAEPAAAASADAVDPAPADYVPADGGAPLAPPVDPLGPLDRSASDHAPGAPLDFLRVTSSFGMRRHPILGFTRMHQGVDFAAREGAPVLAAADGVVTEAGLHGGYGNLLRIRHAGGWATGYAHLSSFAPGVGPGVTVTRGQVVGFVGHTGLATGPHLHYEVSLDGEKLDPMKTPFGGAPADDPHQDAYAAAGLHLRGALTAESPAA